MDYDFGAAATGALTGAQAGSIFGPIGTGVGAVAGGALGLFGSKKKKKGKRISTFDPQQQSLYNDYMQGVRGEGQFKDLFNFDAEAANKNFDQMYSRPAYRNFQEKVVPTITGQFRGANLGNSSYAGEALSRAGRDVQEGLDAHRSNMIYQGSQASQDRRFDAIDRLLNKQTFAYEGEEGRGNGIDQILNTLGPQAGEWFADYLKTKNMPQTAGAGTP